MIQNITLSNLSKGALEELFQYELDKVLSNIKDVNTKATLKRKILIEIVITPDEDRDSAQYEFKVASKTAGTLGKNGLFYLRGDKILENNPEQLDLLTSENEADIEEEHRKVVLKKVN